MFSFFRIFLAICIFIPVLLFMQTGLFEYLDLSLLKFKKLLNKFSEDNRRLFGNAWFKLYVLAQFLAFSLLLYKISNPAPFWWISVYLSFYVVISAILSLILIGKLNVSFGGGAAWGFLMAVLIGVVYFWVSALAHQFVGEYNPVSQANLPYARQMAMAIPIALIAGFLMTIFSLYPMLVLVLSGGKEKSSVVIFIFMAISATSIAGAFFGKIVSSPYSRLLVSQVAFEFDAIPVDEWLKKKRFNLEKCFPGRKFKFVPISTSVEKGYLVSQRADGLPERSIGGYKSEDLVEFKIEFEGIIELSAKQDEDFLKMTSCCSDGKCVSR